MVEPRVRVCRLLYDWLGAWGQLVVPSPFADTKSNTPREEMSGRRVTSDPELEYCGMVASSGRVHASFPWVRYCSDYARATRWTISCGDMQMKRLWRWLPEVASTGFAAAWELITTEERAHHACAKIHKQQRVRTRISPPSLHFHVVQFRSAGEKHAV